MVWELFVPSAGLATDGDASVLLLPLLGALVVCVRIARPFASRLGRPILGSCGHMPWRHLEQHLAEWSTGIIHPWVVGTLHEPWHPLHTCHSLEIDTCCQNLILHVPNEFYHIWNISCEKTETWEDPMCG